MVNVAINLLNSVDWSAVEKYPILDTILAKLNSLEMSGCI